MRRVGLQPAVLARKSGYSRQHLLRVRQGNMEPTRECIAAIVRACRNLGYDEVTATDLFELGEDATYDQRLTNRHTLARVPALGRVRLDAIPNCVALKRREFAQLISDEGWEAQDGPTLRITLPIKPAGNVAVEGVNIWGANVPAPDPKQAKRIVLVRPTQGDAKYIIYVTWSDASRWRIVQLTARPGTRKC